MGNLDNLGIPNIVSISNGILSSSNIVSDLVYINDDSTSISGLSKTSPILSDEFKEAIKNQVLEYLSESEDANLTSEYIRRTCKKFIDDPKLLFPNLEHISTKTEVNEGDIIKAGCEINSLKQEVGSLKNMNTHLLNEVNDIIKARCEINSLKQEVGRLENIIESMNEALLNEVNRQGKLLDIIKGKLGDQALDNSNL